MCKSADGGTQSHSQMSIARYASFLCNDARASGCVLVPCCSHSARLQLDDIVLTSDNATTQLQHVLYGGARRLGGI